MEQNQNSSSGLGIDQSTFEHLTEAARWARFLAIAGFVFCGLIALFGMFANTFFSLMTSRLSNELTNANELYGGMGVFMAVLYIGMALLYFFPCLYLFRFANYMKVAAATSKQENLDKSFQNLKIMFRFVGILTIIVLCLYLLLFIIGMAGVATMGF